MPGPEVFAGNSLLPQGSLAHTCSGRGHWLRTASTEVTCSYLLQQRSLARSCSSGGCWLEPGPAKVAGLGLLSLRSLVQDWSPM